MSSTTHTKPRAVTFSQFSELAFITKDVIQSKKWYTKQENHRFRQTMIGDARRMSGEINNTPVEAITPEQLYECVGIEVFITQGLAMHVAEKKRAHIDAVLSEQMLQEDNGICDIEKLSSVSKNGSRWHRSRAQKLASAYNGLSN